MLQRSGSPRSCTKPDDFSSSDANSHERQNGESRSVPATQPTRRSRDRCYRTRSFQVVAIPCKPRPEHSTGLRSGDNVRANSQATAQNRNPYYMRMRQRNGSFRLHTKPATKQSLLHLLSNPAMLESQLLYQPSYATEPAIISAQLCYRASCVPLASERWFSYDTDAARTCCS